MEHLTFNNRENKLIKNTQEHTTNNKPINIKVGSCFWGHKWTKWEQYIQPMRRGDGTKYIENRQKRTCLKCGTMQDENDKKNKKLVNMVKKYFKKFKVLELEEVKKMFPKIYDKQKVEA